MSLLSRLVKPKKTENIVVYYLSAIEDGNAKASPLGMMPRFSRAFEERVRGVHNPKESSYVNDEIDGTSVMLFWTKDGIDAICFLSADEARRFPNLIIFADEDIATLNPGLKHFPR